MPAKPNWQPRHRKGFDKTWKQKTCNACCSVQPHLSGIPMIYYGDEIGMEGGHDPDCRRGMIWEEEKQDKEIFDLYRRLIDLKKTSSALNSDNIREFSIGDVLCFERKSESEIVYVLFNPRKLCKNKAVVRVYC